MVAKPKQNWPDVLVYGPYDAADPRTHFGVSETHSADTWQGRIKYCREVPSPIDESIFVDPCAYDRERVRYQREESGGPLSPDAVKQILAAFEQLDWVVAMKALLQSQRGNNATEVDKHVPPIGGESASEQALQYCLREAAAGRRVGYGETLRRLNHERLRYAASRRVAAEPVEETRGDAWRAVLQEHQHGAV